MSESAATELSGQKILAVDDEAEILHLYNTFLRFKGYAITAVPDASACIAYLRTTTPDLILLDVNMPGVDGLRLLEMIRMDPRHSDVPVIMISARRDEATVKEAVRLGCDNFIVKPFKLVELAERIGTELFAASGIDPRELAEHALYIRTSIFQQPGMQEYNNQRWDPYPMRHRDHELCLMLPRGMRPTGLAKLGDEELAQRVVVLYRHPLRWKRMWPKKR